MKLKDIIERDREFARKEVFEAESRAYDRAVLMMEKLGYSEPDPKDYASRLDFLQSDSDYRERLRYYYFGILNGEIKLL